ncbi:hypothetical protein H5410_007519 [Solanum commersonii]|uniref:Uncharacterized protein n=1 Tax=Solanum commersonii TaxID=4109 RepID=A0A9J6ACB8_SOLCO|nr:hypothetical protein H5410_007519 [Solanum commersonii]
MKMKMADNGENHAGENKIAEKQEGGGCEANEEIQTLVCFLNSVRMPLLVIRSTFFFLLFLRAPTYLEELLASLPHGKLTEYPPHPKIHFLITHFLFKFFILQLLFLDDLLNNLYVPSKSTPNVEFGISLVVTFNNSLMQLLTVTAIPPRSEGWSGEISRLRASRPGGSLEAHMARASRHPQVRRPRVRRSRVRHPRVRHSRGVGLFGSGVLGSGVLGLGIGQAFSGSRPPLVMHSQVRHPRVSHPRVRRARGVGLLGSGGLKECTTRASRRGGHARHMPWGWGPRGAHDAFLELDISGQAFSSQASSGQAFSSQASSGSRPPQVKHPRVRRFRGVGLLGRSQGVGNSSGQASSSQVFSRSRPSWVRHPHASGQGKARTPEERRVGGPRGTARASGPRGTIGTLRALRRRGPLGTVPQGEYNQKCFARARVLCIL